jgi:predicted enzyme related to lactoylglutathione lyase
MSRVTHFEICANNPEKVVDFYKSVCGWQIVKWEGSVEY